MGSSRNTYYRKINNGLRYISISDLGVQSEHCQVERIWRYSLGDYFKSIEVVVLIRRGTDGEIYEFIGEKETLEEALILADDYLHSLSN